MSNPALGPGTIVRWKGVSPECSAPERHHNPNKRGLGVVMEVGLNVRHDHTILVREITNDGRRIAGLVRPDEIEPVDEWGTPGDRDMQIDMLAGIEPHVHVGTAV